MDSVEQINLQVFEKAWCWNEDIQFQQQQIVEYNDVVLTIYVKADRKHVDTLIKLRPVFVSSVMISCCVLHSTA